MGEKREREKVKKYMSLLIFEAKENSPNNNHIIECNQIEFDLKIDYIENDGWVFILS